MTAASEYLIVQSGTDATMACTLTGKSDSTVYFEAASAPVAGSTTSVAYNSGTDIEELGQFF